MMPERHLPVRVIDSRINLRNRCSADPFPQPLVDPATGLYRIEQVSRSRPKYRGDLDKIGFPRTIGPYQNVQRLQLQLRKLRAEGQDVTGSDRPQESLRSYHEALFYPCKPA